MPEQGFVGSLINIYGIQTTWEETKTHISAEFMNGVYNYVGYYLTFGYYPLFLLFYFTIEFSLIGFGLDHSSLLSENGTSFGPDSFWYALFIVLLPVFLDVFSIAKAVSRTSNYDVCSWLLR